MRLSHAPTRPRLVTTERGRRDHGYVLATFGLLLVPLLLMVGLSVDVGLWYNKSSDIQKAADAAALAGVVWLPDATSADKYARAAAERNGYKDGRDGIEVAVSPVPNQPRRLKVTITDTKVGSFFYKNLGGNNIDLSRTAVAEYVLPVPLGSPENRFGTDPSLPLADQAGLWGNIHGTETDTKSGDAFTPRCRGNQNCGTAAPFGNAGYRTTGYLYTIDVPAGGVSSLDVQVYDAGLYDRGSDESVETGDRLYTGSGTTTTVWTMYDADPSLLDVTDNLPMTTSKCTGGGPGTWSLLQGASTATYKNKWASICKLSGAVPAGRYLLKVQNLGNGASANRYAVRTVSTGAAQARIAAWSDMSMYNNIKVGTSGAPGVANFYLAEVGPEHKGKTLELRLYDPGEVSQVGNPKTLGNGTMKVIAPNGNVAPSCVPSSASADRTFTNNVALAPCQFKTAVNGSAKFNGEWITLQIKIPNTYACTVGQVGATGCWWKIRYEIEGQGNDTTTWAAKVIGDPVHLVTD